MKDTSLYDERKAELLSDGYVQEEPVKGQTGYAMVSHDKKAATTWSCLKCNHVGMEYIPFRKPGTYYYDDYVAVLVCPECGYTNEI